MAFGVDRVYDPLPTRSAGATRSAGTGVTMLFVAANGEDPYIDFKARVDNAFLITESDLTKAAEFIVEHRREQTLAGIDSMGEPFQRYSPSYELRKHQSNVDLRSHLDRDHMTDALDFRVFGDTRRESQKAIEIGLFEEADVILRARLHDQGAVVRTASYHRMEASGKFKRRSKTDKRRYPRKLFAIIPQRKWLDVSPEEVDEATKIIVAGISERLSFSDTPGHKESFVDTSSTRNSGKHFNVPKEGGKIL